MSSTPTPTVLTISGVPTQFVPLPTAWPAGTGCDNNIYEQLDGHFLAWDPYYGASISASARTCLPTEALSWWDQPSLASTAVALGPTFVCPEAYSTVTAVTAKETERVYCCPSNYRLLTAMGDRPSFPSQCVSTPQAGETLTWMQIYSTSDGVFISRTTRSIGTETVSVLGVPVNGFNFKLAATTTSSTSSSSATSQTTSATSETTTSAAASSSGPSLGVSVGVSVGVVLLVLALALIGFLLWRRRKRAGHTLAPTAPPHGDEQSQQPTEYFQPEYKYGGAQYPPQTPYSDAAYSSAQGTSAPGFYPTSNHPQQTYPPQVYEAPAHEAPVYEMPLNMAPREADSVERRV